MSLLPLPRALITCTPCSGPQVRGARGLRLRRHRLHGRQLHHGCARAGDSGGGLNGIGGQKSSLWGDSFLLMTRPDSPLPYQQTSTSAPRARTAAPPTPSAPTPSAATPAPASPAGRATARRARVRAGAGGGREMPWHHAALAPPYPVPLNQTCTPEACSNRLSNASPLGRNRRVRPWPPRLRRQRGLHQHSRLLHLRLQGPWVYRRRQGLCRRQRVCSGHRPLRRAFRVHQHRGRLHLRVRGWLGLRCFEDLRHGCAAGAVQDMLVAGSHISGHGWHMRSPLPFLPHLSSTLAVFTACAPRLSLVPRPAPPQTKSTSARTQPKTNATPTPPAPTSLIRAPTRATPVPARKDTPATALPARVSTLQFYVWLAA
jgi:hypothetical protein